MNGADHKDYTTFYWWNYIKTLLTLLFL